MRGGVITRPPCKSETRSTWVVSRGDVEPRYAHPGGAEPNRSGAEPGLYLGADGAPQVVLLRIGGVADERREVAVGGRGAGGARDDEDGVVAQIGEGDHRSVALPRAKLFGERVGIGSTVQPGSLEQHELELAAGGRGGHRRRLPPVRRQGCGGEQVGEE